MTTDELTLWLENCSQNHQESWNEQGRDNDRNQIGIRVEFVVAL